MQYHAISADGHVNEPPTLWADRLPAKFKERGPRVIETRNTKGHAWIMEGQSRPSPMGFSSMYSSRPRSDTTARRWSTASSRSGIAASATRTCSPARTTPRSG